MAAPCLVLPTALRLAPLALHPPRHRRWSLLLSCGPRRRSDCSALAPQVACSAAAFVSSLLSCPFLSLCRGCCAVTIRFPINC